MADRKRKNKKDTSSKAKASSKKAGEEAKEAVDAQPLETVKKPKKEKTKILFVSPEAQPFAVSGGLGEVVGSLPVSLAKKRKYDVSVVIPLYRGVPGEYREKMTFVKYFYFLLGWRSQYCGIFKLRQNSVTYYFIDNEYYFDRDGLYGYFDDGERFAYFCRAVMEMFPQLGYYPDIVHTNDWQTALVPIYNMSIYHLGFKSIFTIHNVAYQGKYGLEILGDVFGLPAEAGAFVEYGGCINLMKGAIECSSMVTTVSPSYAGELQDPYFGEGLDSIIRKNSFKMRGILNGISTEVYDPSKDKEITAKYTADDLSGKVKDKAELQNIFGLPQNPDIPVIAIISRLVHHKGMQIIQNVMDQILQENVQVVILGVGDPGYENYFRWIQGIYPGKLCANISFNGGLSHRMYAGADMFLMPSLSEPCGLAQMIACRYGTVPIVRETGGLRDSIHDCTMGEGNGFTFQGTDAGGLIDAVRRAIGLYWRKEDWENLKKYIMGLDFGWTKSAAEYDRLYADVLEG